MFFALQGTRTSGFGGPNPIQWSEVAAWLSLSGTKLSLWELKVLNTLDYTYLHAVSNDQAPKEHSENG